MKKLFLIGSFATMLLATGCSNMDPESVTNSINRVYEDNTSDYRGNTDYNYTDNVEYDATDDLKMYYKKDYSNDVNKTLEYDEYLDYKDTSYDNMYTDKKYYNTYDGTVKKDYTNNEYDTYWNNQSEKTYLLDTDKNDDEY